MQHIPIFVHFPYLHITCTFFWCKVPAGICKIEVSKYPTVRGLSIIAIYPFRLRNEDTSPNDRDCLTPYTLAVKPLPCRFNITSGETHTFSLSLVYKLTINPGGHKSQ